jgi:hypothetical protein
MNRSQAWRDFLEHLREITELIRADPDSSYSIRRVGSQTPNVQLKSASTKACMLLISGRLQGCVAAQTQEFLECLDGSGIVVDRIPEVLRAELVVRYPAPRGQREAVPRTILAQKTYAPLWIPGTTLQRGTIRTASLPDKVWNPWPEKVAELLARCGVDLFDEISRKWGNGYLEDLKTYVRQLVEFRNMVAHGDEPQPVGINDVRLYMKWAVRLARACDEALGAKLAALTSGPGWP